MSESRMASATVFLVVAAAISSAAWAGQGDVPDGKQVFRVCAVCHTTDGKTKIGPSLKGIVGRSAGSVAGFHYSRAMKRADLVWTDQNLDKFLAAPQQVVPGTRMPFSGLPSADKRQKLIAYLNSLK
jgi:cytochrome c